MKKIISTTVLAMSLICSVLAQNVEFKASNFKDKKADFKQAMEAIKAGDAFLDAGNDAHFKMHDPGLNFYKAYERFMVAQKLNPNNAELNLKIGNALIYTFKKDDALVYIKRAYKIDSEAHDWTHYYMGLAFQLEYKFGEAADEFRKFKSDYKKAGDYEKILRKRLTECESAKKLKDKPVRAWVDNVKVLNSEENDFAPSITTDGESIIFTSTRDNGRPENELGEHDSDIYTSDMVNGRWESPRNLEAPLNTPGDEVSSMLSYDGRKMMMFKKNGTHYDIFEARQKGLGWELPESFSRNINTTANQTFSSYDYDDIKVYFLSDKNADKTSKGNDIYLSGVMDRASRRYGSASTNGLGNINSGFHEGSVFLHADGTRMFFSSQGHDSMGGYDIFVSTKKQGVWQKPVNLGYPINTPYDDMFFGITASDKYAYISSNRLGGKGGMDIYKITFWGPEKKVAVEVEDFMLAGVAKPISDSEIEDEVTVNKSSLTVFKGKTIDAISGKPVEAELEIIDNSTRKIVSRISSNEATGKFLLSLSAGRNYGIAVKAEGYLFHSENFDIESNASYNLVNKVIELKNIAVGSKIALRNIFFATGSAVLKAESNAELERLVKLLKDVSNLKIEISGHTDNTGSVSGNETLSQKRAEAVVNYLTKKGIGKARMTAQGYGSSKPVATNNSDEGRQQNRRTEFEILAN